MPLSFHHVGSRSQTQVISFHRIHLYQLSHLASPTFYLLICIYFVCRRLPENKNFHDSQILLSSRILKATLGYLLSSGYYLGCICQILHMQYMHDKIRSFVGQINKAILFSSMLNRLVNQPCSLKKLLIVSHLTTASPECQSLLRFIRHIFLHSNTHYLTC